jgi:O-antigen/teichoic acid export membrane protein
VSAPHLILGLYGDRWAGAIVPLQLLAAAGVPRAMLGLAGAVAQACNRVGSETPLQIGFALAITIGATVGSRHGLPGVAVAVSIAIVLLFIAQAQLALSITGATWRSFALAHVPGLLVGLVTLAVILPVRLLGERVGLSHLVILLLLSAMSAASASLGLLIMPAAIRPHELFRKLSTPIHRFPSAMRTPLLRILGVNG